MAGDIAGSSPEAQKKHVPAKSKPDDEEMEQDDSKAAFHDDLSLAHDEMVSAAEKRERSQSEQPIVEDDEASGEPGADKNKPRKLDTVTAKTVTQKKAFQKMFENLSKTSCP